MSTVMQTWVRDSAGWKRPGLSDLSSAEFSPGSTKPIGGTNVGAGIIGATPTTTITATTGVTISGQIVTVAAGTTVTDKVIPYFVNLGDGAVLRNCIVSGPATEQAVQRSIVKGPSTGKATVEWSTVYAQTPSAYYDGLGYKNLLVRYTDVHHVTDGIGAFDTTGTLINIDLIAVHVHDLVQWMPDYVNSRTITHNDGIQLQGTTYASAPADDVYAIGCNFEARRATDAGDATSTTPDNTAAIMMTPNVGPVHLTFVDGWVSGGSVATVNSGANTITSASSLTVTGTRFEKVGQYSDGPGQTNYIQTGMVVEWSGNTHEIDGTTVVTHAG